MPAQHDLMKPRPISNECIRNLTREAVKLTELFQQKHHFDNFSMLKKILNYYSIELVKWPLFHSKLYGVLLIHKNKKTIAINKKIPVSLKLIAIAHLIGHLILHNFSSCHIYHSDCCSIFSNHFITPPKRVFNPNCYAADLFAMELLMPKTVICKLIHDNFNVYEMANYFSMCPQIVQTRLKDLQLPLLKNPV